jgi:4-hydroxyphenylpyruvate dioxygenase-like putative hemolysin
LPKYVNTFVENISHYARTYFPAELKQLTSFYKKNLQHRPEIFANLQNSYTYIFAQSHTPSQQRTPFLPKYVNAFVENVRLYARKYFPAELKQFTSFYKKNLQHRPRLFANLQNRYTYIFAQSHTLSQQCTPILPKYVNAFVENVAYMRGNIFPQS